MNATAPQEIPEAELADWYRLALRDRIAQIEALIDRMHRDGEREGSLSLEHIARSLRSTGRAFGFPRVTLAAEVVERAASRTPIRLAEALCRVLRPIAWPEHPLEGSSHHWIARVVPPAEREQVLVTPDTARAWVAAAGALGGEERLELALAGHLGLEDPIARPSLGALPPMLPRTGEGGTEMVPGERWVCLRVEDEEIHAASSCPVAIEEERFLEESSGRRVRWWITSPPALAGLVTGMGESHRPRAEQEPAVPGGTTTEGEREGRVLVVDDDAESRLLVRTVVERLGRVVREFTDGGPVIRYLEEGSAADFVALVIVDLNMPGVDGVRVVRAIRSLGLDLPVLVLTGDETPGREVELLDSGATDFVRKPVSPPLLAARTRALLRR